MTGFIEGEITSRNGQLIRQLVVRLEREFEEFPEEYANFLSDIGKYTSVSGYMQCTGAEALEALEVSLS